LSDTANSTTPENPEAESAIGHAGARRDVAPPTAAVRVAQGPEAQAAGRQASSPTEIPWRGWRAVLGRTFREIISDRISLVAAGCAFYAVLALFPAISMLISVYGLVFDRASVEPQLQVLRDFLPSAGFTLIADRVHVLVTQAPATLGFSLLVSTLITLWSSATGTKSILSALNMAYEEAETRSFIRFQLTAFAFTIGAILSAVVGLAFLVFLPAGLTFLGATANHKWLIQLVSLLVLVGFVMLGLSLLYRYGPSRHQAKWHWVTPGSAIATLLWLIASAAFSFYVGHFASYDATYGPLGAVIAVMMWFWVTAYVVLLGAELNAELELQTARDSTSGPPKPLGRRGAYVADHVAGS
jgi:membrane protein